MYEPTKRLFDVLLSLIALIVTSPLFAVITLALKLESPGASAFYVSTRVGKHSDPFQMFKFRTMILGADAAGASSTADDDSRITPVGRWVRRSKLDELPQLVNVLRGEMSLVGPRPQVQWIVDMYDEDDLKVLSVRPGMADLAFVVMPREGDVLKGSSDPDGDYLRLLHPEKMRLSRDYVERASFVFDLKILIDAVWVTFTGRCVFNEDLRRRSLARFVA